MPLIQRLIDLISDLPKVGGSRNRQKKWPPERRSRRRLDARKGTRVLIIDDCENALNEIGKLFSSSGYVTLQTQDPQRGVHMARFDRPDLVILDIGMPGMNGFEVLKHIRKDPLAQRVPVIMISGNPRAIEFFQQHAIDADGLLEKPFTRQAVFTRIEKLLDDEFVPRRPNDIRLTKTPAVLRNIKRHLSHH